MLIVSPGQSVGPGLPGPVFLFQSADGAARDLFSLTYAIDDVTGSVPVEVVAPTVVDVDVDSAARIGVGAYAVTWAVPMGASPGPWRIRWSWVAEEGGVERACIVGFEVFPIAPSRVVYGRPSTLRTKLPSTGPNAVSNAAIIEELEAAAVAIERFTRRQFYPVFKQLRLDGRSPGVLILWEPIIAVDSIEIRAGYSPYVLWTHEAALWRVYNRHLTGMINPDDRNNPRIEFPTEWSRVDGTIQRTRRRGGFGRGQQNVIVNGWFGYTEADGSPFGKTPVEIERIGGLMVLDSLGAAGTGGWRLKSESTREQSVTYGNAGGSSNAFQYTGAFTGNPAIDNVLVAYRAPAMMGSTLWPRTAAV